MRRLKTTDAFTMMRLIKEAGVKNEFKEIALKVQKNPNINQSEIGAELILGIIDGLASKGAEKQFYEFCSGILEISIEEMMDMDLVKFIGKLAEYKDIEDAEEWKSFFSVVANLMR